MISVIGIVAEREDVDLMGSHFKVEKIMSAQPRRVAELRVNLHLPQALTENQRIKYENTGRTCPVHHSLHPDIVASIQYHYDV